MEWLSFSFFQHALVAMVLLAVLSGVLGSYIVVRRLVFVTGGVTHASFGGLGMGFLLGVSPILTAFLFSLLSSVGVQWLSERKEVREDSAIAVLWSLGMAIGVITIFLSPGYAPALSSFLFGNILTIGKLDLLAMGGCALATLLLYLVCRKEMLYIAFDREYAMTKGVAVKALEYLLMALVAAAVVLAIRLVGIMLLLSLFTIPQMVANLFTVRFDRIVWGSMVLTLLGGTLGLLLSVWLDIPSGACIIMVMVVGYFLARAGRWGMRRYRGSLTVR